MVTKLLVGVSYLCRSSSGTRSNERGISGSYTTQRGDCLGHTCDDQTSL